MVVPAGVSAGPRALQRLTRDAYENTVSQLLQLDEKPASGLPDDARGASGYVEAGAVGEVDAARLQEAAEALAEQALAGGVTQLMSCAPEGANESACVDTFIRSFGRRAFRRALSEAEVSDLNALFLGARSELVLPVPQAVSLLLSAILQAPQFLYLRERATPDDAAQGALIGLTSDELASRLAYLLWRSMPDDALFASVDAGMLSTPADAAREASRLFADPRSQETVVGFVAEWLKLPLRTDTELSTAAGAETDAFIRKVMKSDGLLESLFTSPVNLVNETLAPIYGVQGITGSALQEVAADPERRFGLLTQVNFLGSNADGAEAHPVKRGHVIFNQLLCGELPPVPANVPPAGPQKQGVSNRERFAVHGANACAAGCHRVLDPLGFAFENYDGTGRFRDMDAGKPVDASGSILLPDGVTTWTFQDARELVTHMATSQALRDCVSRQWLRFALARKETSADEPSVLASQAAFASAGHDLRALFVSVAETPSFLYRIATPPQGDFP